MISNELSIQQFQHYIIPLGTLNYSNVHRLTITTKVTVIYTNMIITVWDILFIYIGKDVRLGN